MAEQNYTVFQKLTRMFGYPNQVKQTDAPAFNFNKDEILKNRREKYRTQHNKDLVNIKVCKGSFTLYFD